MKSYFLKVSLRGISPMVWRRLEVAETTSLARLHYILQAAFHWDNDYLHQFHIYGKDYGINYAGAVMYSDNADKVIIKGFEFDEGDKFTYEYNFFEHWLLDIRIEEISETTLTVEPKCLKGSGIPEISKHDVVDAELNLLEALAKINKTTTYAALLPVIEAYQATKFSCKAINHRIQTELAELDFESYAD